MDPVFAWLENSALSTWIRESEAIYGFPGILVLHTLGMGFLAGVNAAIDLRILGLVPRVPLAAMAGFLPVAWIALAVNVASGLLLLLAYPTKALTNPLFYLKLLLIAGGLIFLVRIIREVLPGRLPDRSGRARLLAAGSLICWFGAIAAGRLLAYTYTRLLVHIDAHF
jgi:hypothetical protein